MEGVYLRMGYKQQAFCPICGTLCDENTSTCPVCGKSLQSEKSKTSNQIETEENLRKEQGVIKKSKLIKAKKTLPQSSVVVILFGVLTIILICACGVQSISKQSLKKLNKELEYELQFQMMTIENQETTIQKNEQIISDLEESISELKIETTEN